MWCGGGVGVGGSVDIVGVWCVVVGGVDVVVSGCATCVIAVDVVCGVVVLLFVCV